MVTMTVRSDLTRIQRTNLETCITVHMHQKESTEDLVRRKVRAAQGAKRPCRLRLWQHGTQPAGTLAPDARPGWPCPVRARPDTLPPFPGQGPH